MISLLVALAALCGVDPWLAARDASFSAWLSDLAAGLHPEAIGQMDLFEAGTPLEGAEGPLGEPDGVVRRRRLSLAVQGNLDDSSSSLRYGAAAFWERGGWNQELSWTGRPGDLTGETWAGGLLLAMRPSVQLALGGARRSELGTPLGSLGEERYDGWGLLRIGRLSLLGQGNPDGLAMGEVAWQVDPSYSAETEGMVWRELSLGARFVDAGRNAWDAQREVQGFGALPLWLDQLRLLVQGGSEGGFERATLQSDLLPQGLVGVDLSYARTRWSPRGWGVRVRFTALQLGWNDPEGARDFGPNGGQPMISLRLRMSFDAPDVYYSPSRHVGPLEKLGESSRAL